MIDFIWADTASSALLRKRFLSFAVVGALGFLVDSAVLLLGVWAGAGLYLSRIFSYLSAATFTWILNRTFTFQPSTPKSFFREWLAYVTSQLSGATINLGSYSALVHFSGFFAEHPVAAVAIGSVLGLAANFVASSYVLRSTST